MEHRQNSYVLIHKKLKFQKTDILQDTFLNPMQQTRINN